MRKFILPVMILLLPIFYTSVSYGQNAINVYASDISIKKYFKFDKPGANKDFYIQLSENIANIFNFYPRHLAYYRFNYTNSQIIPNTHNGALNNSAENCLQAGIIYGEVNQFKISSRDTNVILRHIIPATCFEPADRLSISTNNGESWSNVYSNSFQSALFNGLDIDPSTDSIMYCIYKRSGADSLFRSTNKGQTWLSIRSFSSNSLPGYGDCLISVSAFNHNVIFVKSSNGLIRSSDFGNTFSNVTLPAVNINSFEYDKIENIIYITTKGATPGIFKSTDEGISWVRLFDKPCQSMEIDPLNNNFLYAGSVDGLYRSTNKGLDWLLYNNSFLQSKNVIGVSKSSAMGDTVMVVTDKAIYKVYGEFKLFTDYSYFPLKIGNSWTYRWEDSFFQFGYNKYTVTGDTIVNGYRYYKVFSNDNGIVSKLVALDSLTGNLYWYSSSAQCNGSAGRLLRDSLAARLNNPYSSCIPTINSCNDTSDTFIFGINTKSKRFEIDGLINEQETFAKGFGLIRTVNCEGTCSVSDLQGCVIDGIVYGDTSLHASKYKTYFPLKVGNSWTYKRTIFDPPAPIEITFETVTIISDTTISGVKYYKTTGVFPLYGGNLVTMDSLSGNIFRYMENSTCSQYPKRFLLDSLGAKVGNSIQSCPNTNTNGTALDTNIVTIFNQSVKTKGFLSPAQSPIGVNHRYSEKFGLIQAGAMEGASINYQLINCTLDGVFYSDTIKSISGTVRFSDNNQPASNGYVKAIKLNYSNGAIVTLDSTQIGINGAYTLTHLPLDSCDIVAYPNSEKQADFVPTFYPSTISWQNAVKVYTGNNPTNINISVYRKNEIQGMYSISGMIMPQTRNVTGLPGAIVYIKQGNYFRDYYLTNASGHYDIHHLPAGNYEVIADRLGYIGAQQNAAISNSNLLNLNFTLIPIFTGIHSISNIVPEKFSLYQNYPNPFNPVTNIKFDIPKASYVKINVYNVLGKEVSLLMSENKPAGRYSIDFDASSLTSGVYFYKIETGDFAETKRMVILK